MRWQPTFALAIAGSFLASLLCAQTPLGPEIPVNQRHKGQQWLAQVAAAPNGDFVVTWGSGSGPNLFAPSQAWFRLFAADGTAKTPERRVSNIRGEKEGFPAVAMGPDGSFVIVWHSGGARDTAVYGRRFGAAGQPLGDAFPLSAATDGSQYDPAVDVAGDGSFVAVWLQGPEPRGERADVYFRRFDAAGHPLGPEVQVDPAAAGAEAVEPRVGVDESGSFAVGWLDSGNVFVERKLLAQRFTAAGAPLGSKFQVNTDVIATISPLYDMDVAASGELVFVWTSFDADVVDVGILGRLFAADGSPGTIFEVSAFDVHTQERPAVTFGRSGDFFAAWRSIGTPRTGNVLFVRRFAADGTPRGDKIEIVRSRHIGFDYPAVALDEAGRGVIAWTVFRFNGEIVARRLVQALP
ncbi:MAG TPA: hypothetical protein VGG03_00325 [Thermoanaerobaculia bacterium]|jgi:hypothetical protein